MKMTIKKHITLPPTKKYAIGTEHELIGGTVQIINRWLNEDGFIMLEYIYNDSQKTEENKEVNFASNKAKCKKEKEYIKARQGFHGDDSNLMLKEMQKLNENFSAFLVQQEKIIELLSKK